MATYRALLRGQTPDGLWHDPGAVFDTDAPKGRWMELIDPLDHDGDGKKGGSEKGAASTRGRGKAKADAVEEAAEAEA